MYNKVDFTGNTRHEGDIMDSFRGDFGVRKGISNLHELASYSHDDQVRLDIHWKEIEY